MNQTQFILNSFFQGIRVSSMAQYLKFTEKSHKSQWVLVDIDVSDDANLQMFQSLETKRGIPIFSFANVLPAKFDWSDKNVLASIYLKYEIFAKKAKDLGFSIVVLSLDEDGLLHRLLSPRFDMNLDLNKRIQIVAMLLEMLQGHVAHVGIALTVEELCPGGIDASDGIEIAKKLEEEGAAFILAAAGTIDFPALKLRKPTQLKDRTAVEDCCLELASALWLKDRLKIPIFSQGYFLSGNTASLLAKSCGLKGIVQFENHIES